MSIWLRFKCWVYDVCVKHGPFHFSCDGCYSEEQAKTRAANIAERDSMAVIRDRLWEKVQRSRGLASRLARYEN